MKHCMVFHCSSVHSILLLMSYPLLVRDQHWAIILVEKGSAPSPRQRYFIAGFKWAVVDQDVRKKLAKFPLRKKEWLKHFVWGWGKTARIGNLKKHWSGKPNLNRNRCRYNNEVNFNILLPPWPILINSLILDPEYAGTASHLTTWLEYSTGPCWP